MEESQNTINPDNPFQDCKLDRKRYANALTSIIGTYNNGLVMAVNGKWGTGKTFFMERWAQSLRNDGYKTIMFNAWENDYTSEPMVAILAELKSIVTEENSTLLNKVISKAAKFSASILPIFAKTAASLSGFGAVADIAEKISEETVKAFEQEIASYDAKKVTLAGIKKDLETVVEQSCGDMPLVFIVDELDRCRPDYAVEVLEKIKHLFAVRGVIFVLSIDKVQLGHAVCGYYGSEKIDSTEYLRRFIDLEYNLPEPNFKNYVSHLYEIHNFNEFEQGRQQDADRSNQIINLLSHYCINEDFSLRQLDKIFLHARIAARLFHQYSVAIEILVFLIIVKEKYPKIYQYLKDRQLTLHEISDKLIEEFDTYLISREQIDSNPRKAALTLLRIIATYGISKAPEIEILQSDKMNDSTLKLTSLFTNPESLIDSLYSGSICSTYLSVYTERIDLLEYLNS